jgi:hypothetical protein
VIVMQLDRDAGGFTHVVARQVKGGDFVRALMFDFAGGLVAVSHNGRGTGCFVERFDLDTWDRTTIAEAHIETGAVISRIGSRFIAAGVRSGAQTTTWIYGDLVTTRFKLTWGQPTGVRLLPMDPEGAKFLLPTPVMPSHVTGTSDGSRVAVVTHDASDTLGTVALWSVGEDAVTQTGSLEIGPGIGAEGISAIRFLPDGRLLIATGNDKLFSYQDGDLLQLADAHELGLDRITAIRPSHRTGLVLFSSGTRHRYAAVAHASPGLFAVGGQLRGSLNMGPWCDYTLHRAGDHAFSAWSQPHAGPVQIGDETIAWDIDAAEPPGWPVLEVADVAMSAPPGVSPGQPLTIDVTVVNRGDGAARMVRCELDLQPVSESADEGERPGLAFGTIPAGESLTRGIQIPTPAAILTAESPTLTLRFSDQWGHSPPPHTVPIALSGRAPVRIGYSAYWIETVGNGDNILQPGENGRLHLTVVNASPTPATNVTCRVELEDDRGGEVRLRLAEIISSGVTGIGTDQRRFSIPTLRARDPKSLAFELGAKPSYRGEKLTVRVTLSEPTWEAEVVKRVAVPIGARAGVEVVQTRLTVWAAGENVPLRNAPQPDARVVAVARDGRPLTCTAALGAWYRVDGLTSDSGETIPAWVHAHDIVETSPDEAGRGDESALQRIYDEPPPAIIPVRPNVTRFEVGERVDRVELTFRIFAAAGLKRYKVLVNGRQTLQANTRALIIGNRANPTVAQPAAVEPGPEAPADSQPLRSTVQTHEFDLAVGENRFTVIATDLNGAESQRHWTVTRQREPGRVFVVSIGIDEYSDARFGRLRHAVGDARAFRELLVQRGGVADANARLLVSGATRRDAQPTRDRILAALRELQRKATRAADVVIVYYAGHAVRHGTTYSLVPGDARWSDDAGELVNGISTADLQAEWSKITANSRIFIADSCHAEGLRVRGRSGGFVDFRASFTGHGGRCCWRRARTNRRWRSTATTTRCSPGTCWPGCAARPTG